MSIGGLYPRNIPLNPIKPNDIPRFSMAYAAYPCADGLGYDFNGDGDLSFDEFFELFAPWRRENHEDSTL